MPRKSGASYRKTKSMKLREESGQLPGQTKITKVFSVDKNVNNNSKIEKDDEQCGSYIVHSTDVQTSSISLNVCKPSNVLETKISTEHSPNEVLLDETDDLATVSKSSPDNGTCNVLETKISTEHSSNEVSVDETNDYRNTTSGQLNVNNILQESISLEICIQTTEKSSEAGQIEALLPPKSKLTETWLVSNFDFLILTKKKESGKTRPYIHCTICRDFEAIAKVHHKNGLVPMASGIRVDSQEKLHRVLSHIEGKGHEEAAKAKVQHDLWNLRSEGHYWRKLINDEHSDLLKSLIKLAMDVYNDSLHDTIPAYNWASRSLTQIRADQIVDAVKTDGFDAVLPPFVPSEANLRYRNPTMYSEMLEIVSLMELEQVHLKINRSVCYSAQVDGSVDFAQSDNKFVCCQSIEGDGTLSTAFVGVVRPKENGAKGLLETVITTINTGKLDRKKLVSVTTDGEKANTGRKAGLWKLLEMELNTKILTIWCFCHRSDLALEDLFNSVSELRLWKANILDCTTFFRNSKCHTKSMQEFANLIGFKSLEFPGHHDVRFAQHLNNILKAVIRNMPACRKVWCSIVNSRDSTKAEKSRASDLLNVWQPQSVQYMITCLMDDITKIFTSLEMGLQKSNLVLPDVITLRDIAVRKMEIVQRGTMPGGSEEKSIVEENGKDSTIRSHLPSISSNATRNYEEIRTDIVSNAMELISKRLNVEDERSMELIKGLTTAKSCSELVQRSTDALKTFFMDDDRFDHEIDTLNRERINTLTNDICEQWPVLKDVPTLNTTDVGCKYSTRLRQMFVKSKGELQFLLGALLVTVPHNMGTERVVSHFNKVESVHRRSQDIETVSQRLIISINSTGTASFDPRPAVAKFLTKKDRRFRPSDFEIYKSCEFVKKFFRTETHV